MRPLFATRRLRLLARTALCATALFAGLPLAASQMLVGTIRQPTESYVDSGAVLRRRGHSVLLLDLRAHGGSEGRHTTLGGREREDVRVAITALRERSLGRRGFVLLGVSMERRLRRAPTRARLAASQGPRGISRSAGFGGTSRTAAEFAGPCPLSAPRRRGAGRGGPPAPRPPSG